MSIGEDDEDSAFYWREKFKGMEQRWMCLKDDYAQLARAAGSPHDAWFGDPLEKHQDVVARVAHLKDALNQIASKSLYREQYREIAQRALFK